MELPTPPPWLMGSPEGFSLGFAVPAGGGGLVEILVGGLLAGLDSGCFLPSDWREVLEIFLPQIIPIFFGNFWDFGEFFFLGTKSARITHLNPHFHLGAQCRKKLFFPEGDPQPLGRGGDLASGFS